MDRDSVREVIKEAVVDKERVALSIMRGAALLSQHPGAALLDTLANHPDLPWEDVFYVSPEVDTGGLLTLTINLSKPDSNLVRALVKMLHVRADKEPMEWTEGLQAILDVPKYKTIIEVTRYLPASCKLVYDEVLEPARLVKKPRVVCHDPETDEEVTF